MLKTKTIYELIYQGDSKEEKIKFPFLVKGLHLKILSSITIIIGVLPKDDCFYVATFETRSSNVYTTIEKTNSIKLLNTIMKRETDQSQWLDNKQILMAIKFLEDNNCKYIELY